MSAKSRKSNLQEVADKFTNPKDLSDERKAELLNKEFVAFQKEMGEKLGLQIGVRLTKVENETTFGHQAIMVPVKLPVPKPTDKPTKETPNDEKKSE